MNRARWDRKGPQGKLHSIRHALLAMLASLTFLAVGTTSLVLSSADRAAQLRDQAARQCALVNYRTQFDESVSLALSGHAAKQIRALYARDVLLEPCAYRYDRARGFIVKKP